MQLRVHGLKGECNIMRLVLECRRIGSIVRKTPVK